MNKSLLWKILDYFDPPKEVVTLPVDEVAEESNKYNEMDKFRQPVKEIILGIRKGDWDIKVQILNDGWITKLSHNYFNLEINIKGYSGLNIVQDATWLYAWEVDSIVTESTKFLKRLDKAFKEVEDAENIKKFMVLVTDNQGE